ncbi:MAG: hypothetical protein FJW36_20545 [Acidobacteria bacterium]|nr:hypothetical protein [Acidobacteriota bacterium]
MMARAGSDKAKSDLCCCIEGQPGLDFGGKRNPDDQGLAALNLALKAIRKIQQSPLNDQRLTRSEPGTWVTE